MIKKSRTLFIGGGLLIILAILGMRKMTATLSVDRQNYPRSLSSSGDFSDWKTYTNEEYRFTIQYPPQFDINAHEGSSDSEKQFLSLDIGTKEYLSTLNTTEGTEGVPLFVRIDASIPKQAISPKEIEELGTCGGDYHLTERIVVNGRTLSKCEALMLGSLPSLLVAFTPDGSIRYSFRSDSYSTSNKAIIEQILGTLKI